MRSAWLWTRRAAGCREDWRAVVGLDLLDDIQTLNDLTEDDVLAIQPSGLLGADEELGAVASELSAAVAGVL